MKKIILAILLVALVAGCTQISDDIIVTPTFAEKDDSGYTEEGYLEAVNSNNKFAFDMYERLKDEGANVFFSPYSITTALAMTYEGASGKTAEEMADVFYFNDDPDIMRPAMARMYNNINRPNDNYKLHTANAIWPSKDFPFLQDYFDIIGNYYDGEINEMDYFDSLGSTKIINDWVEEKTEGKIKDIISPGVLNPAVKMVLTNAIHFKGDWSTKFKEENTRDRDFWTSEDESVKVPTMYMPDESFYYMENDEVQVLELPYKGEKLSMLVILPKDDLDSLELNNDNLEAWKNSLRNQSVLVYLPKFTFETKYEKMGDVLKDMGMPTAFSADADFTGMSDLGESLFISDVIHQAFVEVNEEGTEAAAATVVVMKELGMIQQNIFDASHPFVFLIQERESGNILFMGKVSDPR